MKIPLSLIKSFIEIDVPVAKVAHTLTNLGIEVDKIHAELPPFQNVVVAEIKQCKPHPLAKTLQIAEVFDGKESYQVVCSAQNCRPGLKTAFAKVGSKLRDSEGVFHTIEPAAIRDIPSHGMLCSAQELGMYDDHTKILELPLDSALGSDCLELLWDPVLEISLTPNLGHCMSALGIARELSAAWNKPLHIKKTSSFEPKKESTLNIQISDSSFCPRYMGQVLENVQIQASPFWLERELLAAGQRPVNNVVDVTNYILLKYGQPLHAFDYDKIEGKSLYIGPSKHKEPFEAVIGKTISLEPGILTISDSKKTLAIAGVMGGKNSSVTENTSKIFLEAASFDPLAVRHASKALDLRSEGSQRFEKGVAPQELADILEIATNLIILVSGAKRLEKPIDCQKGKWSAKQIRCRPKRINQILGTKISINEIKDILQRLHCQIIQETPEEFLVQIPSFRMDLFEEIDCIEEIARVYGYNNIERSPPKTISSQLLHDPVYLFEKTLRDRLVSLGLQEFLSCDLVSPKLVSLIPELQVANRSFLQTLHAKSEEYSVLRTSLLPNLLQIIKHNLYHKNFNVSGFEIGRIHFQTNGSIVELPMMAIILTGKDAPSSWDKKNSDSDFFTLKGYVENLSHGLRVPVSYVPSKHPSLHPTRQADIFHGTLHIGTLGEIHPNILTLFDIKQKVYYAECNAQLLQTEQLPSPKYRAIPLFPASERDWTLPIHSNTQFAAIADAILAAKIALLERFELIGTYQAQDRANVTLRFTYRDKSKTLSFEEVEAAHRLLQQEVLAKTHLPG